MLLLVDQLVIQLVVVLAEVDHDVVVLLLVDQLVAVLTEVVWLVDQEVVVL